jgi:hypothetical protein
MAIKDSSTSNGPIVRTALQHSGKADTYDSFAEFVSSAHSSHDVKGGKCSLCGVLEEWQVVYPCVTLALF